MCTGLDPNFDPWQAIQPFARGLLTDPEVLILDEPTRALDPVACDELIELILNRIHADAGRTLLIATHRFEEVSELCSKVLVISKGQILACDELNDLNSRGIGLSEHYRNNLNRRIEKNVHG